MDTVRKITSELTIAGQLTLDEIQQLGEAEYRSVINLRSPDEIGYLNEEQQKIECLGIHYVNIPTKVENLELEQLLSVARQLIKLPKPMLVHCDTGIRSSIVALMQISIKQGIKAEDAFQTVARLGLLNDYL